MNEAVQDSPGGAQGSPVLSMQDAMTVPSSPEIILFKITGSRWYSAATVSGSLRGSFDVACWHRGGRQRRADDNFRVLASHNR